MIYGSQIFTFITWSPSKSLMSYPNWLDYGLTIKRKSITGTKIKSLSKFWSSHFSNIFFNIFILYILYSQATHITFICPMLFDSFPLDTQVCKFQVSNQLSLVTDQFPPKLGFWIFGSAGEMSLRQCSFCQYYET